MLNWYRAIVKTPPQKLPESQIHVPTLILWGKQDAMLDWEMAQPSVDLCDDGRLVFFDQATHWVQHEAAEQVNQEIAAFLSE
jgi:pimeloyl-ACP methyl ester carboxylesterase